MILKSVRLNQAVANKNYSYFQRLGKIDSANDSTLPALKQNLALTISLPVYYNEKFAIRNAIRSHYPDFRKTFEEQNDSKNDFYDKKNQRIQTLFMIGSKNRST